MHISDFDFKIIGLQELFPFNAGKRSPFMQSSVKITYIVSWHLLGHAIKSVIKKRHLFWFANLTQHEIDDVILYFYSVHKHRGNSFELQDYKMRLKQIRLNWINSMQVKKVIFTNIFFSWSFCLLNMF